MGLESARFFLSSYSNCTTVCVSNSVKLTLTCCHCHYYSCLFFRTFKISDFKREKRVLFSQHGTQARALCSTTVGGDNVLSSHWLPGSAKKKKPICGVNGWQRLPDVRQAGRERGREGGRKDAEWLPCSAPNARLSGGAFVGNSTPGDTSWYTASVGSIWCFVFVHLSPWSGASVGCISPGSWRYS